MKLTIHRGTQEIGGSCVEIESGSSRLVLDLGLPLVDANREPFDSRGALAKPNELLLAEGILPQVSGLFDENSQAPSGVLLSHAHLDHSGLLHRSRSLVPIYATRGTSKMMLAASVFAGQKELERGRFHEVVNQIPLRVGEFLVTPLAVDHSIFGSVAFLIEVGGRRLLYSGDFRNHGRKPGMMNDLLQHLKGREVDALIVEGTHFGGEREQGRTEFELQTEIAELIATAPALILATFSALDVDRLVSIYKATQSSGRVFVVDAYAAFVLHLIGSQAKVPKPKREFGIRVFFNELFTRRQLRSIEGLFTEDRIDLREILAEPKKHVMMFRPSMTEFDFTGSLPPQCRCLYGYWKGYLSKPDWVGLKQQIAQAGGDFIPAHVSGHAYVADIVRFVNSVKARTVIPIHTFEPTKYSEHFRNVTMLTDGAPFEIP